MIEHSHLSDPAPISNQPLSDEIRPTPASGPLDLSKVSAPRFTALPGSTRFVEDLIGVKFEDQSLLRRAITDRTHAPRLGKHFQLLDYLGDAILELAVRHDLVACGKSQIIDATDLLRNTSLTAAGRKAQLDHIVLFHFSGALVQVAARIPDEIVADVVEAVIGATFLDQGFEKAHQAARTLMAPIYEQNGLTLAPKGLSFEPARGNDELYLKLEQLLNYRYNSHSQLALIRESEPVARKALIKELSFVGLAAQSVVRRDCAFDEIEKSGTNSHRSRAERNDRRPWERKHQPGQRRRFLDIESFEPKRVRNFNRRVGPGLLQGFSDLMPGSDTPKSWRRISSAIIGSVYLDGGYEAVKRVMVNSSSRG